MYTKDKNGNWVDSKNSNAPYSGKWVWYGRDFVPYDPHNPQHQGLPQYDQGWSKNDGSLPFYGDDVNALLMQYGFPGAASGMAFGSSVLEPQRQKNILDLLNQATATGAESRSQAVQRGLTSAARGQADQASAYAYGGNAPRNFQASAGLAAMNNANMAGNSYRVSQTDPMTIAMQRAGILEGAFRNPMADQIRGFIPGLQATRQDGSFFGDLLNTGLQLFGAGAFKGRSGGGGGGGGGNGVLPTPGSLGNIGGRAPQQFPQAPTNAPYLPTRGTPDYVNGDYPALGIRERDPAPSLGVTSSRDKRLRLGY